jgi:hypothetical protein
LVELSEVEYLWWFTIFVEIIFLPNYFPFLINDIALFVNEVSLLVNKLTVLINELPLLIRIEDDVTSWVFVQIPNDVFCKVLLPVIGEEIRDIVFCELVLIQLFSGVLINDIPIIIYQ